MKQYFQQKGCFGSSENKISHLTFFKMTASKKFFLLLPIFIFIFSTPVFSQCSGGTLQSTITPTTTWQTVTVTQAGNYFKFAATSGTQYEFSFCGCSGGSASYDTQLTVLDNTGAYAGGYNDDFCGLQSDLTWTAPSTGTFRILVSQYFCTTNATSAVLGYKALGGSSGAMCYTTSVIASTLVGGGGWTNTGLTCDDCFTSTITLPFTFCFNGNQYSQLLISSNGYITFNTCGTSGGYSDYALVAIPSTTPSTIQNSIMCPWMDLLPQAGSDIQYKTTGATPNRIFIVSYNAVTQYSCTNAAHQVTSQIKLYETSNNIDLLMNVKPICPGWESGSADEGLIDATGANAIVIAGRNFPTNWTTTGDAYKLTYTCGSCPIVLPIELTSLTGKCNNGKVTLNWQTETETNNRYFTIERTIDGSNYEAIDTVAGAGNSSQPINYSIVDNEPYSGTSYYRLKQTDVNGQFKYFTPIEVSCDNEATNFSVFPNPSAGTFTVNSISDADLSVTNTLGQIVYETKTSSTSTEIDLKNEPAGIYFIRINSETASKVKKIIINK